MKNSSQEAYVGDIFLLLALAGAKRSVTWLIGRLTPETKYTKLCDVTFYFSALWGVASALMVSRRCDLSHPWISIGEKCTNFVSHGLQSSSICTLTRLTDSSLEDYRWIKYCH